MGTCHQACNSSSCGPLRQGVEFWSFVHEKEWCQQRAAEVIQRNRFQDSDPRMTVPGFGLWHGFRLWALGTCTRKLCCPVRLTYALHMDSLRLLAMNHLWVCMVGRLACSPVMWAPKLITSHGNSRASRTLRFWGLHVSCLYLSRLCFDCGHALRSAGDI